MVHTTSGQHRNGTLVSGTSTVINGTTMPFLGVGSIPLEGPVASELSTAQRANRFGLRLIAFFTTAFSR